VAQAAAQRPSVNALGHVVLGENRAAEAHQLLVNGHPVGSINPATLGLAFEQRELNP
jgi:hypothetical protein